VTLYGLRCFCSLTVPISGKKTHKTHTHIYIYIYIYIYTYLITYFLTPWSRVLLEKLIGSQLIPRIL